MKNVQYAFFFFEIWNFIFWTLPAIVLWLFIMAVVLKRAGNVFVLTCWSSALRGGDFALGPGRAMLTVISLKDSLVVILGGQVHKPQFLSLLPPLAYLVNNIKTIVLK